MVERSFCDALARSTASGREKKGGFLRGEKRLDRGAAAISTYRRNMKPLQVGSPSQLQQKFSFATGKKFTLNLLSLWLVTAHFHPDQVGCGVQPIRVLAFSFFFFRCCLLAYKIITTCQQPLVAIIEILQYPCNTNE